MKYAGWILFVILALASGVFWFTHKVGAEEAHRLHQQRLAHLELKTANGMAKLEERNQDLKARIAAMEEKQAGNQAEMEKARTELASIDESFQAGMKEKQKLELYLPTIPMMWDEMK